MDERGPEHQHKPTDPHAHTRLSVCLSIPSSGAGPDVVHSDRMARALLVLERMVGQNAEDEIFHDCKFWDDPSDAVKVMCLPWVNAVVGWTLIFHLLTRTCTSRPHMAQADAWLPPPALAVRHRAHAAASGMCPAK